MVTSTFVYRTALSGCGCAEITHIVGQLKNGSLVPCCWCCRCCSCCCCHWCPCWFWFYVSIICFFWCGWPLRSMKGCSFPGIDHDKASSWFSCGFSWVIRDIVIGSCFFLEHDNLRDVNGISMQNRKMWMWWSGLEAETNQRKQSPFISLHILLIVYECVLTEILAYQFDVDDSKLCNIIVFYKSLACVNT